jgi:hypothetical protein
MCDRFGSNDLYKGKKKKHYENNDMTVVQYKQLIPSFPIMKENLVRSIADLLTPAEAKRRLGLRSRTSHTLRLLELRGLLKPVRLNSRTIRYDPADLEQLIERSRS